MQNGGKIAMERREYQVKDIMQMFGITRDTIRYYEKQGLIEPMRTDNGYRTFDLLNVEKLKKVLDLRNLGFSVKEVKTMFIDEKLEKNGTSLIELRKRTEEKMEKIRLYEQIYYEDKRFMNGFNMEYDFCCCINCPMLQDEDMQSYFICDVNILSVNVMGEITGMEKSKMVLNNIDMGKRCRGCLNTSKRLSHVYRGIVRYENDEQVQRVIQENYTKARREGYKLSGLVYITKKILTKAGKGELFLNIRIPIKDD